MINVDIFYENLKRDIEKFYNDKYQEESLKELHLALLHENYQRSRFQNTENLEIERIKFLTELQLLVERHSLWYG